MIAHFLSLVTHGVIDIWWRRPTLADSEADAAAPGGDILQVAQPDRPAPRPAPRRLAPATQEDETKALAP